MATLAELRTTILEKLDDGSVQRPTGPQVDAQINSTINFYENNAFWFTQEIASLTTTPDSRILSGVPSDFKMGIEPNTLVIIQGNVRYPLIHLTPLAFDTKDVDAQGRPIWYTYRDGNFELYYIPDIAYDVRLFYRKSYADLVSDTDSNDFTNFTDRLIEYRTLADLLLDYREDEQRASLYFRRAEEEHRQILTETYNRTATGNLSTESIIGNDSNYFYENFY